MNCLARRDSERKSQANNTAKSGSRATINEFAVEVDNERPLYCKTAEPKKVVRPMAVTHCKFLVIDFTEHSCLDRVSDRTRTTRAIVRKAEL